MKLVICDCKHLTALIVDDQINMRRVIRGILLRELYFGKVHDADSVSTAIDILHKNAIDIIVVDWTLADETAIKIIEYVHEVFSFTKIPVIVLTADPSYENICKIVKCGSDACIIKPFTPVDLIKKITFLLSSKLTLDLKD